MNKKKVQITFALIGIQTLEFAIIKEFYSDENSKIEFGINAEFAIKSPEEHEIMCAPEISFLQDGKPFIKIKTACSFSVKPEEWKKFVHEESQSIVFPKGFTDHLLMLSIGTLRGVLHAKTEGTVFNKYLLPTINVAALSEGDIEMRL